MKLYIISPCRHEDMWRKKRSTFTLPQMSLAILAALTPPGIELKVIDELVDEIDFSHQADLVALSINTTSAPRSYEVADRFREKGATIVMGGIHPSAMPKEALGHADSVVIGEAETVWPTLLEDFAAGTLKQTYTPLHPDPQYIPTPRWDVLNPSRYYVPRTFQVSRGCPYGCSFCSSTRFFGTKYRFRDIGKVVEELKAYPKNFIVFIDDNICGNADYLRELLKAIAPLKKRWVSQCSVDIAKKEGLLELARQSGCAGILIGFESIKEENRADVRKLRSGREYSDIVSAIHGHGIGVHGSFMFGFDNDDAEVIDKTVEFALQNRLQVANYCKLTPYPGTKLFDKFQAEGRLLHTDWSKYDRYNIVFKPKNIGIEELRQKTDEAYKKTFSLPSILRRRPPLLRDYPAYLGMNLSYRFGSKMRRDKKGM